MASTQLSQRAIKRIQQELQQFNKVVLQPKATVSDNAKSLLAKRFGAKSKVTSTEKTDDKPQVVEKKEEEIKTIFLTNIDDSDMSKLLGMVIGPNDTPYEGAIFYFNINLPNDYPIEVPVFKFITPNEARCRMHPNLYAEGKCCLSILNTWASNQWCATATLENILTTIRGILIDNPIICEPGFERCGPESRESIHYCITARHRALTAGFVDFIKRKDVPPYMMDGIKKYVRANIEVYRHAISMLNADLVKVGLVDSDGKKTSVESVAINHLHSGGFILTRKRVRDLIKKIEETIQAIMSE